MTYPSANESVAYTVCKIFTLLTINILAKGGAKFQPRGCKCTPFLISEMPCPIRLHAQYPLNDSQGGARGFIVNRV